MYLYFNVQFLLFIQMLWLNIGFLWGNFIILFGLNVFLKVEIGFIRLCFKNDRKHVGRNLIEQMAGIFDLGQMSCNHFSYIATVPSY